MQSVALVNAMSKTTSGAPHPQHILGRVWHLQTDVSQELWRCAAPSNGRLVLRDVMLDEMAGGTNASNMCKQYC